MGRMGNLRAATMRVTTHSVVGLGFATQSVERYTVDRHLKDKAMAQPFWADKSKHAEMLQMWKADTQVHADLPGVRS